MSKSFGEPSIPVIFINSLLRIFDMLDCDRSVNMLMSDGVKPVLTSRHMIYSLSFTMFSILQNSGSSMTTSFSIAISSLDMWTKSFLAWCFNCFTIVLSAYLSILQPFAFIFSYFLFLRLSSSIKASFSFIILTYSAFCLSPSL